MPMTWSLSSLGLFEKCQLRYRYKYIDKLPEPRSTAANRGVDTHRMVELYVKGEIKELTPELATYTAELDSFKAQSPQAEHKIALTRDWKPTQWGAEDAWYRGVLDLKTRPNPEHADVYDWKTGKIYPDHDDQRSIYSVAVLSEEAEVRTVRAVHIYFDIRARRQTEFHRDQVPELQQRWTSRVGFLERTAPEDMIPSPGYHCRYCPHSAAKGGPCRF